MRRLILLVCLIAFAAIAAILVRVRVLQKPQPLNVVMVVFDTCRADHLGCYGYASASTPNVDRLASEGILFRRAYAQVPLTLPSHTTLFTGTFPEYHGIRDNAAYVVPSEQTTLAEVLNARGYTTAAFVGAFPIDARFGLNQGFGTYDGHFPRDSQRSAEAVNAAVEEWISAQTGTGPYFVFIHYFDPHLRYLPPEPYAQRFKDAPYDGEIAYADFCLGQLRRRLDTLCPPGQTLWVFTADHGEGLWGHEEQDHGIFLYDTTIRVPLIFSSPGRVVSESETDAIAELADVMPTVLDFLDVDIPATVQGSSLLSVLKSPSGRAGHGRSHAETYFPRLRHGWSGLRSLRTKGWLFVAAPNEELYDLEADPDQIHNVVADYPDTAVALRALLTADLDRFGAPSEKPRPVASIDPETEARLLSLGYLGRVSKTINEPTLEDSLLTGPDPKDRIAAMGHVDRARNHIQAGVWPDAEQEIWSALNIDPDFPDSRRMLAEILEAQGRHSEAAEVWGQLAGEYADDALYHTFWAKALEMAGRADEAEDAYRRAVGLVPDPSRMQFEYVLALARMSRWSGFERESRRLMSMQSLTPQTLIHLSLGLLRIHRTDRAYSVLEECIARFHQHPDAYNLLAWDLIDSGADIARGIALAERAANLAPGERTFLDTLGWGYLKAGQADKAVETLEKAAEGPLVPDITHHLALAYLEAGDPDAARSSLRRIADEAPDYQGIAEVESILGDL